MTDIINSSASSLGSSSDDDGEVTNRRNAKLIKKIETLERSQAELKCQVRKLQKQNILLQQGNL